MGSKSNQITCLRQGPKMEEEEEEERIQCEIEKGKRRDASTNSFIRSYNYI